MRVLFPLPEGPSSPFLEHFILLLFRKQLFFITEVFPWPSLVSPSFSCLADASVYSSRL